MLHGAGGIPAHALGLVEPYAVAENLVIVAPKSAGRTWDIIEGRFGPDVATIERALAAVFAHYPVDPVRIAIAGFSDGASYALTLGLANGSLFRTVMAFSPGSERAPRREGKPRIFISHGSADRVLPIAVTSHRLVPALRRAHYAVTYYEYEGGHTVPVEAVTKALALLP